MQQYISIRGAREHNLKNINIDIPRDKLIVITGLSGSGKSSLAFDTIYAEGQRRYVESLSAYARQFLQLMQKPDVDTIDGLSPAISIEQKTTSKNPRSTVGTVTELYDYMRLLYARIGVPYSPATGLPIEAQTISQIVDKILEYPPKSKLLIMSPIIRGRKGEYKKELQDLKKRGFQRIKIDDEVYDLDDLPTLNKKVNHNISVVVDRIIIPEEDLESIQTRLASSVETALNLSDGLLLIENLVTQELQNFSSKFSCPVSGFSLEEIEPRLFSFNNPFGACPSCDGLGIEVVFDDDLIVPDKNLSIAEGAILPWSDEVLSNSRKGQFSREYYSQVLDGIVRYYQCSNSVPFAELPEIVQKTILHGSENKVIPIVINDGTRNYITKKPFEGVIANLKRRWLETENDFTRDFLGKFQNEHQCSACNGQRLKPEALCVKISELNISEVATQSIQQALEWFNTLQLTTKQQNIAERILKEIRSRLSFLVNVGLGYLTLSRTAGTLSGGESQRIRLASQIGSALTGVLYVLDEPSIGLHQRDNDKLLDTLRYLRDLGNTVIVVEHDEDAIRMADHIIDMGPAAGVHGGEIVCHGPLENILRDENSLTGQYLNGKKSIPVPNKRRKGNGNFLTITGANINNLKNISTKIPLGTMTCVTGVSGGGKSSLVISTIYKALSKILNRARNNTKSYQSISGVEYIDKVIDIDQSPIGRTPRSNPVTYIGCFTNIREWFASLPEAKSRGYGPGRFSFNIKGGRCEACQGDGVTKIEMHFLPDVYVRCDQCHGKRYNRETLEIVYKGKNIADILDMTVEEGIEFFDNHHNLRDKLQSLMNVGLGYLKIGQQATTLSGGEAQRVKLAKELSKRATGKTFYILDEPTTGLHFEDIRKLMEVLHCLVEQGNTVLIIEHNLEVIKTADWIIDMGPEGGSGGGKIIAEGTPEQITKVNNSYTGKYLQPYLRRSHN